MYDRKISKKTHFILDFVTRIRYNGFTKKGEAMKYTLKTLRSLKNWTQSEAAESIGVSVDAWSKWERGKNAPGYKNVQKIVDTFGVPYDDIIFLPSVSIK